MKKLILALVLFTGCIPNYSNGTRAGQIIKFSHKGILNKTWEGTMVLGGFKSSDNGVVANTWDFTVLDDKLVPQIQAAQESGKRVQVHYNQEWVVAPWRAETGYFVDSVTE